MSEPVVVIGAGLGGLAAACHLRGRGREVVVVERADGPGGRVTQYHSDGYTLDLGATVLTMPELLAEPFAAVGAALDDHLELVALDPMYRATFGDGSELLVRRGRAAMTEEIRRECGAHDARAFGRFCDWLQRLYDTEMPAFIGRNFDSPLDLARTPLALARLLRLGALRRLAPVVDRAFDDERLRRVLSFQALYAGLSPFDALAAFAVITYMDTVAGVYAPIGGMGAVGRALATAAEKAGVEIRYGCEATQVLQTTDRRVAGVALADGTVLRTSSVVVNADLPDAYARLLPGIRPPRLVRTGAYSPSCVLWVAGVRGAPPAAAQHHNIHFGRAWRGAFDELVGRGEPMTDPSILVSVASQSDPALAPAGGWTLYALEPAPHLDGAHAWTPAQRSVAAESLRARVASLGYDVGDIACERVVDPVDWAAQGLAHGTPFGLAHRFFQSGPFRPSNVERRVPGCFFSGASTVPGIGVPMVLISGRLAAERVAQWEGAP